MSLLTAREVSKRYGPVVALRSATLVVEPGEVHALLGANGAGKSTLVKMLTGVIRPDGGTILVNGQASSVSSPAQAARIGLAPVFQDPALVPDLTVAQNLRLTRTPVAAVRRHLRDLDLDIDFDEQADDVPLPLLRMIDLARALARDPQLLILDEITAALPADLAERVFDVMRRQKESGRSVLFITHRLARGDRRTATARPCCATAATSATLVPQEGGEEKIVEYMLGEAVARAAGVAEATPERERIEVPAGPTALEVRGLQVGETLTDVSFALRPGEILGIAALEAQGQDELFDVLSGQQRQTGGEILVQGEAAAGAPSLRRDPRRRRARAGRPAAGAAAAALDRARTSPRRATTRARRWGPIDMRDERRRVRSAIDALSIDTRAAAPGAPALGRQPAEGDDRALARQRVPDAALLRPDPRHRRRHEAPDLRAAAAARRRTEPPCSSSRASWPRSRSSATASSPLRRQGDRRARRAPAPTRRRSCARCTGSSERGGRMSATAADAAADAAALDWRAARAPPRLDGRRLRAPARRSILYWRTAPALPWGPFDVQSLAIDALPLAFAAMAQAVVVISGGIDLSIGSLMSLINVVSAKYMFDATTGQAVSFREAIVLSFVLILGGALAGVADRA